MLFALAAVGARAMRSVRRSVRTIRRLGGKVQETEQVWDGLRQGGLVLVPALWSVAMDGDV